MNLNATATDLMWLLYNLPQDDVFSAIDKVASKYGVPSEKVSEDACKLLKTVIE
ncbi:MAG: hypothetical protein HGA95_04190 [Caldiserica bacterium]|nr:hypothetical protein [Caldisericota bacterium]